MGPEELATTFINKIPQTIPFRDFIIKTYWGPEEIKLQILDNHRSKAWEGSVCMEIIRQTAEELEIPYDQFLNECKEALTRNGGVEHFQYLMELDQFSLVRNEEFPIQYIGVSMKVGLDLQNPITVTAVELIGSVREKLYAIEQEVKVLNEKYQSVVEALEKCLEEKDLIEKNLLQKFARLLNSKKDKIAELENLLVEKSDKLRDTGTSGTESSKRKSTEMMENSVNNVDDDFMLSTQVMTQPVVTLPKRRKLDATDEVVIKKNSEKEIVDVSTQEKESADVANEAEIEDSPDIFDQI